MSNVLEKLNLTEYTLLICDRFDKESDVKRLLTDIGVISKPDFAISHQMTCFGLPTTTNVLVKKKIDCTPITKIEFEI